MLLFNLQPQRGQLFFLLNIDLILEMTVLHTVFLPSYKGKLCTSAQLISLSWNPNISYSQACLRLEWYTQKIKQELALYFKEAFLAQLREAFRKEIVQWA